GVTLGAASGWSWVPWSSSLHEVVDADHCLMSSESKSRDNAVLLSLVWLPWDRGRKDWAFDLNVAVCNGPSYVGLMGHTAKKNWAFQQEFRN
ncbi:hypothetical protein A2U01_0002531, partial [Trifolium medium]|nr:hypothetical protein [Trifolium medium]